MGRSIVIDLLFEEMNWTVADAIATEDVLWASNAARELKGAIPAAFSLNGRSRTC
jgi:hypothetical protein